MRRFRTITQFCHSRCYFHHNVASILKWSEQADLVDIERNIVLRCHKNNIPLIKSLLGDLEHNVGDALYIKQRLVEEVKKLPNVTHPRVSFYGNNPKELMQYNLPNASHDNATEFSNIGKHMNLYRMNHLGNYTGHKSYYLMDSLACLEQSLVQYALSVLKKENFQLVSVPDILPSEVIESCGMVIDGERAQIYKLDSGKFLSGTSEMALAGYFANKVFHESDLPVKVTAVSRCYRAETSGLQEEKGIYRVHQFTKVEMFAVCTEEQSETMIESFKNCEISLFKNLGLNIRLLDMPPSELGASAYQKYDIEAWMPGRKMWGEISSCSNCTDYQGKRLNICYRNKNNELKWANTVNGTAVAIPRLLIALIETNQVDDYISVPAALRPYMKENKIRKDKRLPEIKLIKLIK